MNYSKVSFLIAILLMAGQITAFNLSLRSHRYPSLTAEDITKICDREIESRQKLFESAKEVFNNEYSRWQKESLAERCLGGLFKITAAFMVGGWTFKLFENSLNRIKNDCIEQLQVQKELEAYGLQNKLLYCSTEKSTFTGVKIILKEMLLIGMGVFGIIATYRLAASALEDLRALEEPKAPDYQKATAPLVINFIEERNYHTVKHSIVAPTQNSYTPYRPPHLPPGPGNPGYH